MTRTSIYLFAAALAAVAPLAVAGCKHEGPAERAGEKIDRTVDEAKDKLENKGPAEKAGEKIDKATGQK